VFSGVKDKAGITTSNIKK